MEEPLRTNARLEEALTGLSIEEGQISETRRKERELRDERPNSWFVSSYNYSGDQVENVYFRT